MAVARLNRIGTIQRQTGGTIRLSQVRLNTQKPQNPKTKVTANIWEALCILSETDMRAKRDDGLL